ncbi:MAG: hypothetical protein K0Q97_2050 [Bacillota bacterium]|jgi:hypothetical protein|nr:hypothetical protein [Bacillota bacterium]
MTKNVKSFDELNWPLFMEKKKEPETLQEIYDMLFPINEIGVEEKFLAKPNIEDILFYVKEHLANFDVQNDLGVSILERLLILCNQVGEYDLSLDIIEEYNISRLIDFLLGKATKGIKELFYQELIANYFVTKYKSLKFDEKDYTLFQFFIINNTKRTWFDPEECHEILIEIYIKLISKTLSTDIRNELLVQFPIFFLKKTSMQYVIFKENNRNKIESMIKKCQKTNDYKLLDKFYQNLLKFVQLQINENIDRKRKIEFLDNVIKSLTKKVVEFHSNSMGCLISSLMEFLTSTFIYSQDEFSNIGITIYGKIIRECKQVVYKADLLKKHHFIKEIDTIVIGLFRNKKYDILVEIYLNWLTKEQQDFIVDSLPFEIALSLQMNGILRDAKDIYKTILTKKGASAAVLNNLASIYIEEKKYEEALTLLEDGKSKDPDDSHINDNLKIVQKEINKIKQKPQKMKNLYFKETEKIEKRILFTIYKLENEIPIDRKKVMEAVDISNENFIVKLLNRLIKLEMVLVDDKKGYVLDKTIYELVRDYIDPKLERQIVRSSLHKLYRPIFYHESEINLYRVLTELFPQHFVFPNMDLKTIIDVEKIKKYLDSDILDYFFKAHVDFAIIDTTTYFPIISYEKDSEYQDREPQKTNAIKKNTIFQTSGLPLIRLRYNSAMDYERLKEEIKQATKDFLLDVKAEREDNELLGQFDLKSFGIQEKLPSVADLSLVWEKVVGDIVAKKTENISLDEKQAILTITLSPEIKPIIELSKEALKTKIYQEIKELNQIIILFSPE